MIDECLGIEVRIEGDDCPLCAATRAAETIVDARPPLHRRDGNSLLRFSAARSDALAETLEADERVRYLYRARTDGRESYRCLSMQPCVVQALVDAGFLVDSLTYADGGAEVTGAVVGQDVLDGVMATAGETVGVELQRVYALGPEDDTAVSSRWDLTPAQAASLRRAVEMGYFTVPRQTTASEVADSLGISKTAFLERVKRALNGLLPQLLDVEPPE